MKVGYIYRATQFIIFWPTGVDCLKLDHNEKIEILEWDVGASTCEVEVLKGTLFYKILKKEILSFILDGKLVKKPINYLCKNLHLNDSEIRVGDYIKFIKNPEPLGINEPSWESIYFLVDSVDTTGLMIKSSDNIRNYALFNLQLNKYYIKVNGEAKIIKIEDEGCTHSKKYLNVISASLQFWYCPMCKREVE